MCLVCLWCVRLLSSLFSSVRLRALLSFQDLYVGLTPYQAPAVFSLLQVHQTHHQGITSLAVAPRPSPRKPGLELYI